MNNLPLQPLVWKDYGKGTASETRSALHEYDAWQTDNDRGWIVGYFDRRNPTGIKEATGFATIDEAKQWAWNHYNEKMQPYVKPMPTWIDASDRLPEKHTTVLVVYHAHFDDEPITEFDVCTAFFDGETFDPKDQLFYMKRNTTVVRWMPIPESSNMQNNKGE